jgi:hypothetical protein
MFELIQIAESEEPGAQAVPDRVPAAATDFQLAEIGVTQRQVAPQVP